ncbi:four-carbon acid sugar kinase family protein [Halomonas sp. HNIBRBA4712]|uniref:four-carbon acid sugar kinase family protein n=1 Tax=Halomonas sp. HNIBRBA4712 TaxID=3373087 RepID=UPI0037459059
MVETSTTPLTGPTRLIILADDLSGAADCAVSFARAGLKTSIELARKSLNQAEVVVFDTDSRHLAPEAAAAVNVDTWRSVRSSGPGLYKKIDSTLRGNWAQEVAALIPEAGMAIVAPAMPLMKRYTRGARQYIDDTPVEQTPVWQNEGRQGRASLDGLLDEVGVESAYLSLDALRNTPVDALGRLLLGHRDRGVGAVVCDAETDEDLDCLARAARQLSGIFWVGSAGLSNAICASLLSGKAANAQPGVTVAGPVLTVVGSMSAISHRQVDHLLAQGGENMACFTVAIDELLASTEIPEALAGAQRAIERGQDVLVTLARQAPDASINGYALSQRLASHLGGHLDRIGALVATGGETARALLGAADIDRMRLLDELEPGVALSVTSLGAPVVTKAGAFGREQTLTEVWQTLVRRRAPR